MRALLAERRLRLVSHCSLEDLEAYHRGQLDADQREEIAEHLAVCEDCTILLLYAVIGAGGNGQRVEPFEVDVDEEWRRLRPYLQDNAPKGTPLGGLLVQRRLSIEEALQLGVEISRVLAALHAEDKVLPSLRSENVLVSPSGEIQLLGVGFTPTPESLGIGYGQSAAAAVVDLYRSLSPEEIAGEEPDQRSNLFSLGVLLYELLTGVSPFRAETPIATATRILSLEPVPIWQLDAAVGPAVSKAVERLLAKEPEERPPSAAAVLRELESALGRSGSPAGPAPEVPDLEGEIERLYDELIALARTAPPANGAHYPEEIERVYARLLELQAASAERFRVDFEASLAMPIDAGENILARIRAVRKELEDLAGPDATAAETDAAQAPAKLRQ